MLAVSLLPEGGLYQVSPIWKMYNSLFPEETINYFRKKIDRKAAENDHSRTVYLAMVRIHQVHIHVLIYYYVGLVRMHLLICLQVLGFKVHTHGGTLAVVISNGLRAAPARR